MRRSTALLVAALAALVVGCTTTTPATDAAGTTDDRLQVVATTSVLGDVVRAVAGEDADVEVLLPPGADPHSFALSGPEARTLRTADLVVANGLGLEATLADVLEAAVADGARVLEVAPQLAPITRPDGSADPHFWFDLERVAGAAGLVADELAELDDRVPDAAWHDRARRYGDALADTAAEVTALLQAVPPERRVLVTNHDALGYLADVHGYEVLGTVVPGDSTLSAASAADLSDLAAAMRAADVRVVFSETTAPDRLARALAQEVGDEVLVVELHTGSLGGPGSGVTTVADLVRTTAQRIATALGQHTTP